MFTKTFGAFIVVYIASTWTILGVSSKYVDEELKPYVEAYYKKVEANCDNNQYNSSPFYQIVFKPQEEEHIAVCYYKVNGYKIEVDPEWWNRPSTTESDRIQLMNHELSHCVLNLGHRDDPLDYMFPSFVRLSANTFYSQLNQDIDNVCNTAP